MISNLISSKVMKGEKTTETKTEFSDHVPVVQLSKLNIIFISKTFLNQWMLHVVPFSRIVLGTGEEGCQTTRNHLPAHKCVMLKFETKMKCKLSQNNWSGYKMNWIRRKIIFYFIISKYNFYVVLCVYFRTFSFEVIIIISFHFTKNLNIYEQ